MEAQIEEAAWGQGEGFHILLQIMMYWEATVGLGRESPIGGCSVPRPVCASVIQGFANEWEALSGFKQSSARGGPRRAAGSPGLGSLRIRALSTSGQFHGYGRLRTPGRPGKDNGYILQASRLGWGPSGSFPRNIFLPPLQ